MRRATGRPSSRRLVTLIGAASLALTVPGVAAAQMPKLSPQLDSVRTALNKYQDPIMAVHDGYLSTISCIEFTKPFTEMGKQIPAGGMGVHLLNMGTIGPTLDPAKPQVLIYEPKGDKLVLVAAEWFMPAQMVTGAAPTIFGQTLLGPMEGHPPIMPPEMHHYDLHVWLWKDNPAGVFSPTNPAVSCPKGGYSHIGDAPVMVGHQHN